ncbi:protein TALPID3 [Aulostomus maculatus]
MQKLPYATVQSPLAEQQQRRYGVQNQILKPRHKKPDIASPLRAATTSQHDRLVQRKQAPTVEEQEPRGRSPLAKLSPIRKLSAVTVNSQQPGHELLTSSFTAGTRGVVLAALKQCSHSTPRRREVNRQLLEPHQSSQSTPGLGTSSQSAAGIRSEAGLFSFTGPSSLIKAQSNVEVCVPQLVDDIHRLQQTESGWGSCQQILQQLEILHSHQLQMQSQLLDLALRVTIGQAPGTTGTFDPAISDHPGSGQPTCLHLDPAANSLNIQQQSSMATIAAEETSPVAMATSHHDRWPGQSRADHSLQGTTSVSPGTQTGEGSYPQRLNRDMPKEMELPEVSSRTSNPAPEKHMSPKSQQNQLLSKQIQDQRKHSQPQKIQSHSQQKQTRSQQHKSRLNQCHSRQIELQQVQFQQTDFQTTNSQSCQTQSQQSQCILVQQGFLVPSMLEDASQALHQVRRQKKVLEENLESLLRAKTGELLHCQLETLAANRDSTDQVQIKKTVDAWIETLTKDIQTEMSLEETAHFRLADAAMRHPFSTFTTEVLQQRADGSRGITHWGSGWPVNTLRGTGSKIVTGSGNRGPSAGHRPKQRAEPDIGVQQMGKKLYLNQLYSGAPHNRMRRTLKKTPYLRFNSSYSLLCRKPCPCVVESVRAVKVKSFKSQTTLDPPLSLSPGLAQSLNNFSYTCMTSGNPSDHTLSPAESYPIHMAIPLCHPKMDSFSSRHVFNEHKLEVTSPLMAPPTISVTVVKDAVLEPPSHTEKLDAGGPPPPKSVSIDIPERKSEEEEDEEIIIPGNDFLSNTQVVQEEGSVRGEEGVELNGGLSPPSVFYQGPVFPPQGHSALLAQRGSSILHLHERRDTLENQLVEWVEQQLVSRMISERYCPPSPDPTQINPTDQSELEGVSVTSDIDSNVSVDSQLIRQLVNEVMKETVTQMLGQRNTPDPGTGVKPVIHGLPEHEEEVPLGPTPVLTPSESPAPPVRESTSLETPPSSEPINLLSENSPHHITAPGSEIVVTPTTSQEPTPSAGSPPAVYQTLSPFIWDAELPLDKERLQEHVETHTQSLVMSTAVEEPPLSSLPPRPVQSSPPPLTAGPRLASSFSEDSTSSTCSSAVTAGTSGVLKPISEGELFTSADQLAAMTEEQGFSSLSNSLLEMQDMDFQDFDYPIEGQVRSENILLTLLTKMEQGITQRRQRPQPEGAGGEDEEDLSVGEVRDSWTKKPKGTTASREGHTLSPGQTCQGAAREHTQMTGHPGQTVQPHKQDSEGDGAQRRSLVL